MIEGRIIKGVGGLYTVATAEGAYECSARGIFRKRGVTPTVGDFVTVDVSRDSGQERKGSIASIAERKNSMERPRVANVDQLVMVFSVASPALNADLLDRFILTAEYRNIPPVICFSKTDLHSTPEQAPEFRNLCAMYEAIGYPVALVCVPPGGAAETGALLGLLSGKVSVFAGPSGVGKSSLINSIVPGAAMETGDLSRKIQRGKHTTRHTELMEAFPGSFIVDSPGFTTLNMDGFTRENLPALFREFRPFLGQCRFTNCAHQSEPDCAVKAQVGRAIDPLRYERYSGFMAQCEG